MQMDFLLGKYLSTFLAMMFLSLIKVPVTSELSLGSDQELKRRTFLNKSCVKSGGRGCFSSFYLV